MRRPTTFLCGVLVIVAVAAVSAAPASARPRGTNGKILINRADNSATGEEQTFTVDKNKIVDVGLFVRGDQYKDLGLIPFGRLSRLR